MGKKLEIWAKNSKFGQIGALLNDLQNFKIFRKKN